ncbi:MAG: hypothetical protein RQ826_02050 [Xanthomonadales bacterium]|nr:hypothetical protein [Xanthomonadales bacterium]
MPITDPKKWIFLSLLLGLPQFATAQTPQPDDHDYFSSQLEMIRNGVQAVLMCNGLFTSRRSLQQVFEQELAYMLRFDGAVGTADGGAYRIDRERRIVAVGGGEQGSEIAAAFRPASAAMDGGLPA